MFRHIRPEYSKSTRNLQTNPLRKWYISCKGSSVNRGNGKSSGWVTLVAHICASSFDCFSAVSSTASLCPKASQFVFAVSQ